MPSWNNSTCLCLVERKRLLLSVAIVKCGVLKERRSSLLHQVSAGGGGCYPACCECSWHALSSSFIPVRLHPLAPVPVTRAPCGIFRLTGRELFIQVWCWYLSNSFWDCLFDRLSGWVDCQRVTGTCFSLMAPQFYNHRRKKTSKLRQVMTYLCIWSTVSVNLGQWRSHSSPICFYIHIYTSMHVFKHLTFHQGFPMFNIENNFHRLEIAISIKLNL